MTRASGPDTALSSLVRCFGKLRYSARQEFTENGMQMNELQISSMRLEGKCCAPFAAEQKDRGASHLKLESRDIATVA